MRVGIEAQRIFRDKKHGMDFVALELIKHLPKDDGNEYFVFINTNEFKFSISEFGHVNFVATKLPYPVWEQFWLPKQAKHLNLDVLHCTANTFPIRCSVPIILTLHDIIFLENNPLKNRSYTWYQRLGNYYRKYLVKYHLDQVKEVVTVSDFERRTIESCLSENNKFTNIKRVYNGVGDHFNDTKIQGMKKLQLIEKYSLPNDFVLFLGNTDPKKNTPNTLKAFVEFARTNKKAHLVIGDLNQDYLKKCFPKNTPKSIKDRVLSLGYIDNKDLPGLLKLSKVFLYPSIRESFGIPLLEAMKCGIPVISSNTSSMPEITEGAALLINPHEVPEISNALHKVWNNLALRNEMSLKGIQRSEFFKWSKMSNEYSTFYSEVA